MRRALNGWLLVSVCLLLMGAGAVIAAQSTRGATVPPATIKEWRRYATEVERGQRTPSPAATRMLTETAIAQHEYANAAQQLLRVLGTSVALVALLLVLDLARYRTREGPAKPPGPSP
jgi:hypothetical protein